MSLAVATPLRRRPSTSDRTAQPEMSAGSEMGQDSTVILVAVHASRRKSFMQELDSGLCFDQQPPWPSWTWPYLQTPRRCP